ncbi:MAG: transketolase [Candidatus Omnitrophica bacterium]|nr:transketolase [Candidatus Omnitrophota bacterium]
MSIDPRQIREDILTIAQVSGHGHIPSCFSVIEILVAVYQTMRHDPENPHWPQRDIFILSKGHAALAHYCVLARLGYFPIEQVEAFGGFMSNFGCHADRLKVPGVEVSTGSLGHGIGVAVGEALAFKIQGSSRKVIVLIGDGEANEGTVWEALMVAADRKLTNLTVILDHNVSQGRGLQIYNPVERLASFGCATIEVAGHSVEALEDALRKDVQGIKAIVAKTKKGFGCKTLVDQQHAWHRRSPTEEELCKLKKEICEEEI